MLRGDFEQFKVLPIASKLWGSNLLRFQDGSRLPKRDSIWHPRSSFPRYLHMQFTSANPIHGAQGPLPLTSGHPIPQRLIFLHVWADPRPMTSLAHARKMNHSPHAPLWVLMLFLMYACHCCAMTRIIRSPDNFWQHVENQGISKCHWIYHIVSINNFGCHFVTFRNVF